MRDLGQTDCRACSVLCFLRCRSVQCTEKCGFWVLGFGENLDFGVLSFCKGADFRLTVAGVGVHRCEVLPQFFADLLFGACQRKRGAKWRLRAVLSILKTRLAVGARTHGPGQSLLAWHRPKYGGRSAAIGWARRAFAAFRRARGWHINTGALNGGFIATLTFQESTSLNNGSYQADRS